MKNASSEFRQNKKMPNMWRCIKNRISKKNIAYILKDSAELQDK